MSCLFLHDIVELLLQATKCFWEETLNLHILYKYILLLLRNNDCVCVLM